MDSSPYIKAATLVTRYMNLPTEDFFGVGFGPQMRAGVVSREGHVLMAVIAGNQGIVASILDPSITENVKPGRLVIPRDFSRFNRPHTSFAVEPTDEMEGDSEILEVLDEVCTAVEAAIYPRRILAPDMLSNVKDEIQAALGERAASPTLVTHLTIDQLQRGARGLYRQFFQECGDHGVVVHRIRRMRDQFNQDFEAASLELPCDVEPGPLYTVLNYMCDNMDEIQRATLH